MSTLHRTQSRLHRRFNPFGMFDGYDMTSGHGLAVYGFTEIFKALFFPFNSCHQFGDGTLATTSTNYLKYLKFTKDFGRTRYDLTQAKTPGTRFNAIFDPGDSITGSPPSLGIRLEKHRSSRLEPYRNRARSEMIAESFISLQDIKYVSIRRLRENDFAHLEGYNYFSPLDQNIDHMYEISVHFYRVGSSSSPYSFLSRKFAPGPFYRHYESAGRQLKDLHKNAESIKFIMLAPNETWLKLQDLQQGLGARDDPATSSNTVYFSADQFRNGGLLGRNGGAGYGRRSFFSRYGPDGGRFSPSPCFDDYVDACPPLRSMRSNMSFDTRRNDLYWYI
ncbi:hypothetical protein TWF694_006767 [Orbilia ellipsospora]|uniref:Uncharacterized protein n=1 Tax=Orbilia ellipsospora TaxID=2528407 RepID=A0AAV9XMT7_9PEZI